MARYQTQRRMTMNDRINEARRDGFIARQNGQDTLYNPFLRADFKAEHEAWSEGWLAHQERQLDAEVSDNA